MLIHSRFSGMVGKWMSRVKREALAVRSAVYHRLYVTPKLESDIVNAFHRLFYTRQYLIGNGGNTSWFGVSTMKCPLDMWIYQEILFERRPAVIVETGTAGGGSALCLAHLCDLLGEGRVVSIDIEPNAARPIHPRIRYLTGSSTDEAIIHEVRNLVAGEKRVMVILDSDHRQSHVLRELRIYNELVTVGDYLIVEDTNVNGHPVYPEHGPGPKEAVDEFLKETQKFEVDRVREKLFLSFNAGGYLRKTAQGTR